MIFCTDSTRLHRRRLPLSCAFHFRYYISSLRLWSSKSIVWLHAMYASYILFRNNFFLQIQIKYILLLLLWFAFIALIRRRMHTKIIKMFRIQSQEIAHKRMKDYKKYKRDQNTTIATNTGTEQQWRKKDKKNRKSISRKTTPVWMQ